MSRSAKWQGFMFAEIDEFAMPRPHGNDVA